MIYNSETRSRIENLEIRMYGLESENETLKKQLKDRKEFNDNLFSLIVKLMAQHKEITDYINNINNTYMEKSSVALQILFQRTADFDEYINTIALYLEMIEKGDEIFKKDEFKLLDGIIKDIDTKSKTKISRHEEERLNDILDKLNSLGGDIDKLDQEDLDYLNNFGKRDQ